MSEMVHPNARDCSHGSLRRSCEICERDERIAELVAECTKLLAILTRALDTGLTSVNYDAHECIETTIAARAALKGRG